MGYAVGRPAAGVMAGRKLRSRRFVTLGFRNHSLLTFVRSLVITALRPMFSNRFQRYGMARLCKFAVAGLAACGLFGVWATSASSARLQKRSGALAPANKLEKLMKFI
jgi:hypothetical protein